MIYALRTAPPQLTLSTSKSFDMELRNAFEALHRDLHDDAWHCATLPFSLGGLGLSLTTPLSTIAYYSSLLGTYSLVRETLDPSIHHSLQTAIYNAYTSLSPEMELPAELEINAAHTALHRNGYILSAQYDLTDAFHRARLDNYLSKSSAIENPHHRIARNLTCRTQSANLPFTELPVSKYGTKVDPEIWDMMIMLRLGNPVFAGNRPCPRCAISRRNSPPLLDVLGVHATTCPSMEGYIRRHNHIWDKLISILRHPSIGLRPKKEYMFPIEEDLPLNERHRMDILIDDLELSSRPYALDVFVVSPYTTRAISNSSKYPAGATIGVETQKTSYYQSLCSSINAKFYPLGIDTHGGLGKQGREILAFLASFIARRRGTSPSSEYMRLVRIIASLTLQLTAHAVTRRSLDLTTP